MKVKISVLVVSLCTLHFAFCTLYLLHAQTLPFSTTSYSDVSRGLGTRAMGMAGAFTGIADDASSFYWNPAGLVLQERSEISTEYGILESKYWYSYLNYSLPRSSLAIMRNDISSTLSWNGNNGQGLGDIFIFSHAIPMGKLFSMGLTLKGISADAGGSAGYGCDLGLLLKTERFRLGFTAYNLIAQVGSTRTYKRYRIGFGIGPFSTVMIGAQIEVLDIGLIPAGPSSSVYVLIPQIRTGIEGWLIDGRLGIRAGYYLIPYALFNQPALSNEQVCSVGASLKLKNFSLDYAYMISLDPQPPTHSHWVTTNFMWGKTKADIAAEEKAKLEAIERDRKAREMLLIVAFSETIAQKNSEIEALRGMGGSRDEVIEGLKTNLEKVKSDSIVLALELEKVKADSQVLGTQAERLKAELLAALAQADKIKTETLTEKEKFERIRAIGAVDPLLKEAIAKGIAKEIALKDVPEGLLLRFNRDFFFSGSSLEPVAYRSLDVIIKTLKDYPGHAANINGYTDSTGKKSGNLKISLACARAIASYLIAKGIPENKVFTHGYGPDNNIAPNSTKAGRKQNRRVEVIIYGVRP